MYVSILNFTKLLEENHKKQMSFHNPKSRLIHAMILEGCHDKTIFTYMYYRIPQARTASSDERSGRRWIFVASLRKPGPRRFPFLLHEFSFVSHKRNASKSSVSFNKHKYSLLEFYILPAPKILQYTRG